MDGKVVETPWHVACPAEGTIKLWLIDSGCGHDLNRKNEVSSSGGNRRAAPEDLAFNTAIGRTIAREQAVYQSAE